MSAINEIWFEEIVHKYVPLKKVFYSDNDVRLSDPIIQEDTLYHLLDGQHYRGLSPQGRKLVQETLQATAVFIIDLMLANPADPVVPHLALADVLLKRGVELNPDKGSAGVMKLAKKLHDFLDDKRRDLTPDNFAQTTEQVEAWYRFSRKDKGRGSDATTMGLAIFLYEYRSEENPSNRQEALSLLGSVASKGNAAALSTLSTIVVQGGLDKNEARASIDFILQGARKSRMASADALSRLEENGHIVAIDADPTKPQTGQGGLNHPTVT